MTRPFAATLIVACAALRARAALSAADDQVIPVTVQLPYGFLFLQLPALSAVIPSVHGWEYEVVMTTSNSLIFSDNVAGALANRTARAPMTKAEFDSIVAANPGEDTYYFDGEVSRLYARIGTTVAPSVLVGAVFSAVRVSGGEGMDGFIEAFHNTFGFPKMYRDVVTRGQSTTAMSIDGHEVFLSPDSRSGLDDPLVFLTWAPDRAFGAWRMSLFSAVKIPVGSTSRHLSTGSADFGTAFALTGNFGRWCVNLNAGAVSRGNVESDGGLDAAPGLGASAAFGYKLETTSLWLELQWEQSPFRTATASQLGSDVYDVTFGVRFPLGGRVRGFLALTENVFEYENSSDIALHGGLTWTSPAK